MKDVSCYLCESPRSLNLFDQNFVDPYISLFNPDLNKSTRHWKACQDCGFVYRSPMPNSQELEKLYAAYGDDIFKKETPDAYFDRIDSLPPEQSENHPKALWLANTLKKYWSEKSVNHSQVAVLDVGCGAGLLMHKLGPMLPGTPKFFAVELNPDYAKLASRRLGAEVKQELYRASLFSRKFEVVMCTKVLEHILDPRAFIRDLNSDLADDGILFLEVPDLKDIEELPADHDRFYIPHLYFFSTKTLPALLAEQGLRTVSARSIKTHRGRNYLQVLAVKDSSCKKPALPYDDAEAILKARRLSHQN